MNDIKHCYSSTASLIKDEWLKIAGIEKVAAADGVPGWYNWNWDVRDKELHNNR